MKTSLKLIVLAAALVPALSFADSSAPVTRAQVKAELAQLEAAGYQPGAWMNYPAGLQRAETIVAQQNSERSAYGGVAGASSEAGSK